MGRNILSTVSEINDCVYGGRIDEVKSVTYGRKCERLNSKKNNFKYIYYYARSAYFFSNV